MSMAKALLVDVPLKSAKQWWTDDAMTLAAALAYYTLFSLAPLFVVAIAVAGFVVDEESARAELKEQMETMIGPAGATVVDQALTSASDNKKAGVIASVIGIVTVLLGSTGLFVQMQSALNGMWGVQVIRRSARGTVRNLARARLISFSMVLAVGLLLLSSLVASALLARLDSWVGTVANFAISLILVTFLFMLIFKFLPDVEIAWKDVWIGALVTAILFGLGKFLLNLYIERSAVGSSYGAAGSLVVVMVWVWFTGCVLYYGAEYTQIFARNFGSKIRPADYAECVDEERTSPDHEVRKAAGEAPPARPAEAADSKAPPRRETPVARLRKQEEERKK